MPDVHAAISQASAYVYDAVRLGAGKFISAAEGIEAIGGALGAIRAVKGGTTAIEAAKAASVGAIAFDPHAERLSNLIQSSPALANPVNAYLAAKPDDSAAVGRMKNALESLGMDAALVGVLGATVKGYKAVGAWKAGTGSAEEAVQATHEIGQAMDQHNAIKNKVEGVSDGGSAPAAPAALDPANDSAARPLTVTSMPAEGELPGATADAPQSGPETHTDAGGRTFTKDGPEQPWVAKPGEAANDNAGVRANAQVPDGSATDAPSPASDAPGPSFKPSIVLPEQARSIYEGAASDMDAFSRFGSWDGAIANGHIFGKGGSIPYQKLAGGELGHTELDAFVSNTAELLKDQFDAAKGGAVLSDARVNALVQQRYDLYGEDPAALMGVITRAGEDANSLVANMEASFAVAQRGYQDAYALAARIKSGDLTGFGTADAAMEGLRQRIEVASSAWSSGQAMRAASGRALRRLRSDFRLQLADVEALKSMDPDALVELLNATGGDPRALQAATQPALLPRITDAAQFLYTNNLLWGLRTHFINFSTNFYMVAARPMERILGSMAQSKIAARTGDQELAAAALQTRQEALHAYTYMGATLSDNWKSAVEAFKQGDSIMAPHSNELATGTNAHGDLGRKIAQLPWKPWDSLGNVTANALMVAAPKAIALPSRSIGAVDEFIKGISYRSNVLAKAHVNGVSNGLEGAQLSTFVRDRLYAAFDDAGHAVDAAALQEAKVATFQQDLLPGTLGSAVQGLTGNIAFAKFILPFVRTPTNVIRYGWKLTPVLNGLQAEYRNMILGHLGPEQQAQAIGQMAMGSLFMGLAAYLHHSGSITGGGPGDPVQRNKLKATGWQPYSFVHKNDDGSLTYTPYGRFDPLAMPFGMVADVSDVLHAHADTPDSKIGQSISAMMLAIASSVAKSFSEKSYLKSMDDTLQAALDPDSNGGQKLTRVGGQMVANFVPGSSLMRNTNPDPYLRETRHFIDATMAEIPGFSFHLPPKRDAFGDPINVHKGLWVNSPGDMVDAELRRMGEVPDPEGKILGPPAAKFKGGIDLRDITMVDGRNAYDRYQELARQPAPRAQPIKDVVARVMQTSAYKNAPGGEPGTKGTKMSMITDPMRKYREVADREMMGDKNVRDAAYKKQMATVSAYANRQSNQNPTAGNATNQALGKLQGAFTQALTGPR